MDIARGITDVLAVGASKAIHPTGNFNWSPSAAHTNDEKLLVIHSPQLAKHFTREMDRLWRGAELGITPHLQRKLERQKIRCGDGDREEITRRRNLPEGKIQVKTSQEKN